MIAGWMLYSLVVAALAGGIGGGGERLADASGRPRRWVWLAALAISVALPLGNALVGSPASAVSSPTEAASPGSGFEKGILEPVGFILVSVPLWLDRLLVAGWMLASLTLVGMALRAAWALHRLRGSGRRIDVDGAGVLVAPDAFGPSVAGLFRPTILLPAWLAGWNPSRRQLVVAHEEEHRRARDPWVALAGLLSLVAVPWNPFVWWQVRRLRLALEVDCDRRVLERLDVSPRDYGEVLVSVASRSSGHLRGVPFIRRAPLERRIRAMTATRPPRPAPAVALIVVLCVLSPFVLRAVPETGPVDLAYAGRLIGRSPPRGAWALPDADLPPPPDAPAGPLRPEGLHPLPGTPPDESIRRAIQWHHPTLLESGLESGLAVWFVARGKSGSILRTGTAGGTLEEIHDQLRHRYPGIVSDYVLALEWIPENGSRSIRVLWFLADRPSAVGSGRGL